MKDLFLTFLTNSVSPKSPLEDVRRREFILNVLLMGALILMTLAIFVDAINQVYMGAVAYPDGLAHTLTFLMILAFILGLYVLSRKEFVSIATYLLLATLFAIGMYMASLWGVNLPAAILFYVLTIVMAGVLVSTRFAFVTTAIVCLSITILDSLHTMGIIIADHSWAQEGWGVAEVTVASAILFIIATVSWLSNREIERFLIRARKSEVALTEERDLLEVRVLERTEELRKAELERMTQAYRFVEFGRLASGIFHDLANPLTALSLNIESIAAAPATNSVEVQSLAEDIELARSATTHMQRLMESMRRHLSSTTTTEEEFSLNTLLEEVLHTLQAYAYAHQVHLSFESTCDPLLLGDPIACMQIYTNIISNAIESFPAPDSPEAPQARRVEVALVEEEGLYCVRISDTGPGMTPEILESIFEPFFSTKAGSGLGLGLPLAKKIVEEKFAGEVIVESIPGAGTTFAIYFPIREP